MTNAEKNNLNKEAMEILLDDKLSEALKRDPAFGEALAEDLKEAGVEVEAWGDKNGKKRKNAFQCWSIRCWNVVGLESYYLTQEEAQAWNVTRMRTIAKLSILSTDEPLKLEPAVRHLWAKHAFGLATNLGCNRRSLPMILKLRGIRLGYELGIL